MVQGFPFLMRLERRRFHEAAEWRHWRDAELAKLRANLPDETPLPPSGVYIARKDLLATEPIEIDATKMKTDVQMVLFYYLPMKRQNNFDWSLTIVVRRGEVLRAFVPEGMYEILVLTGDRWRGDEYGLYCDGIGRYIGHGFRFGGLIDQIGGGTDDLHIRKTRKKYPGFRFVLLPFKDGSPGFGEVKIKRIKQIKQKE